MSQFGSQFHGRATRTLNGSGKIKRKGRDKRRSEMGGYFIATKLGDEDRRRTDRVRGGSRRSKLQHAAFANLLSGSTYKKVKIRAIMESKDNRNFARLNIITKGTVIDTEDGKAVVTNRPGREGFINAKKL